MLGSPGLQDTPRPEGAAAAATASGRSVPDGCDRSGADGARRPNAGEAPALVPASAPAALGLCLGSGGPRAGVSAACGEGPHRRAGGDLAQAGTEGRAVGSGGVRSVRGAELGRPPLGALCILFSAGTQRCSLWENHHSRAQRPSSLLQ